MISIGQIVLKLALSIAAQLISESVSSARKGDKCTICEFCVAIAVLGGIGTGQVARTELVMCQL